MNKKAKQEISVGRISFQYAVEYDIDGYRPGCDGLEENSCDDICRCYTIEQVKIREIPWGSIMREVSKEFGINLTTEPIKAYGLYRILKDNKMFDPENYRAEWSRGYYGDEVDNILFEGSVTAIDTDIREFLKLSTLKEQAEWLLIKEYGFVLEKLKNREWHQTTIDKELLVLNNEDYTKRLFKDTIEFYNDWDLIHAICLKEKDIYRVIDGYHRTTALLRNKKKKIANIIYAD